MGQVFRAVRHMAGRSSSVAGVAVVHAVIGRLH